MAGRLELKYECDESFHSADDDPFIQNFDRDWRTEFFVHARGGSPKIRPYWAAGVRIGFQRLAA